MLINYLEILHCFFLKFIMFWCKSAIPILHFVDQINISMSWWVCLKKIKPCNYRNYRRFTRRRLFTYKNLMIDFNRKLFPCRILFPCCRRKMKNQRKSWRLFIPCLKMKFLFSKLLFYIPCCLKMKKYKKIVSLENATEKISKILLMNLERRPISLMIWGFILRLYLM